MAFQKALKCLLSTKSDKLRVKRSLDNFKGMIFVSDGSKELELCVDAPLAGE